MRHHAKFRADPSDCNDKVLKLFGRRVGLCVEWSDVNGVQVCCK